MPSLQNHSFWRQMAVNYINRCYLEPKLLVRKKKKEEWIFIKLCLTRKPNAKLLFTCFLLQTAIYLISVCACLFMVVQLYMCRVGGMDACAQVCGVRSSDLGICSQVLLIAGFERGSLSNLELARQYWLGSLKAWEIYLFLVPQSQDYRCMPPHSAFYKSLEAEVQALMTVWQTPAELPLHFSSACLTVLLLLSSFFMSVHVIRTSRFGLSNGIHRPRLPVIHSKIDFKLSSLFGY